MCEHERLRTIGDRVFCCICKAELPLEFLINQGKPAEPPAPEQEPGTADQVPEPENDDQGKTQEPEAGVNDNKPAEPEPEVAEPVPDDQNQAENQADGKKPGKPRAEKKRLKRPIKGGK